MRIVIGVSLVLGLCLQGATEEVRKPRPKTLNGLITKVEGMNLTVTTRGDSGEKNHELTLSKETKILLETAEDIKVIVKGEGGDREVTKPKTTEGKPADLKTGQRVSVQYVDSAKVNEVRVLRPAKVRKEGER